MDSFAAAAQTSLPGGFLHVQGLLENFANQGLNVTDLVALSGDDAPSIMYSFCYLLFSCPWIWNCSSVNVRS